MLHVQKDGTNLHRWVSHPSANIDNFNIESGIVNDGINSTISDKIVEKGFDENDENQRHSISTAYKTNPQGDL